MLKREVAKRVFAREFEAFRELEKSVISDSEAADSKTPNLLISPLGLILNRIFIVGVITELDSVGTLNETWKARIVDPTGAFTVYSGQYQPEASILFGSSNSSFHRPHRQSSNLQTRTWIFLCICPS